MRISSAFSPGAMCLVAASVVVPGIATAELESQGNDFKVAADPSYPDGYAHPGRSVSRAADDGSFVVVWERYGGFTEIAARRFTSNGTPLGQEFVASSGEASRDAAVLHPDADSFVVVWTGRPEGSGFGATYRVLGRRFDSTGQAMGEEFQVGQTTPNYEAHPAVTPLGSGQFVVVWQSEQQQGQYPGLFGQRLAADGSAIGTEFVVHQPYQRVPPQPASGLAGRWQLRCGLGGWGMSWSLRSPGLRLWTEVCRQRLTGRHPVHRQLLHGLSGEQARRGRALRWQLRRGVRIDLRGLAAGRILRRLDRHAYVRRQRLADRPGRAAHQQLHHR